MKNKKTLVVKFGGTSVGSIERIQKVAEICAQHQSDYNLVVAVSAMGDTTDDLVDMMNQITNSPSPREKDLLLSAGEQISISLLAMALQEMGVQATALLGWQAKIKTSDNHGSAKILNIDTEYIQSLLDAGNVVVVAGFQGISDAGEVLTLGRGGSDTTAVALAAALEAERCDIYTDVNSIKTTDPRIVKNASEISHISYDEMLELASLGAQVLHPRSVEIAKNFNIPLRVRSSWEPNNEGTLITENIMNDSTQAIEAQRNVRGVALDRNQAYLSIQGVPDKPGIASQIFCMLSEQGISVDLIVQSVSQDNITEVNFTTNREDGEKAISELKKLSNIVSDQNIEFNQGVAKVSIVGAGMINQPGIASRMFQVLGDNGINIKIISTSEIFISCVIDECQGEEAVRLIHEAFEL